MTKLPPPPPQPSGLKASLTILWAKVTTSPCSVGNTQCITWGERVCLSGGNASLTDSTSVIVYDCSSQRCGRLNYIVSHFAMVVLPTPHAGQQLLLIGGYNRSNDRYSGQVSSWEQESKSWNTVAYPPMRTERGDSSAAVHRHWILVAGGCNAKGRLSSVEALDTTIRQWYQVDPLPLPSAGLQHAVSGDMWYLLGGDGILANQKRAYAVSMSELVLSVAGESGTSSSSSGSGRNGSAWKTMPEMPLGCPGVAIIRGNLYAVGGKDATGHPRKEIHIYLPGTWEWLHVCDLPSARHSCTCTLVSNRTLVVMGGAQEGIQTSSYIDQGSLTFPSDR